MFKNDRAFQSLQYPTSGVSPLCARVTHGNFSNHWSSALSSVDTVRLPKELCTHKKGKAFNFLSLTTRVKLEIL